MDSAVFLKRVHLTFVYDFSRFCQRCFYFFRIKLCTVSQPTLQVVFVIQKSTSRFVSINVLQSAIYPAIVVLSESPPLPGIPDAPAVHPVASTSSSSPPSALPFNFFFQPVKSFVSTGTTTKSLAATPLIVAISKDGAWKKWVANLWK